MRRLTAAVVLLVALSPNAGVAQSPTWFELYDEAIKHVQQGEYEQAEAKLLRAQKEGPASGRSVLRYGSLRPAYFPEYYLGIVYVSTDRPQDAIDQFQRARKANINPRDAEFRAITTFEGQAKAALRAGGGGGGTPPGPKPTPPVPTAKGPDEPPSPPPVDYGRQFSDLVATARTQLAQRNFDASEQSATSARDLAIKYTLAQRPQADALLKEIEGARLAARVETALERRDAATARSALGVLTAAAPNYRADALRDRVDALERELRGSTLQRDAMSAFFRGDYDRSISLLSEAEKTAALTPRGHFYRACSLAALAAATANPERDGRLADARRSYAAAAAGASQFRDDLRYISPKVRQLLGIK